MRNKVIPHMQKYLPRFVPATIFDVGANTGQSVMEYGQAYPDAVIHAFEPVAATYEQLVVQVGGMRNVACHRIALSDREGSGVITSNGTSTGNRLVEGVARGNVETVQLSAGDSFCAKNGIEKIDFLKIDAEGADLSVLVGFSAMLREGRCYMLQVECGLSPENNRHVSLDRICNFLFPFGYRIYGFFGIARHLGSRIRRSGAMFCDAAFIREDFAQSGDTGVRAS